MNPTFHLFFLYSLHSTCVSLHFIFRFTNLSTFFFPFVGPCGGRLRAESVQRDSGPPAADLLVPAKQARAAGPSLHDRAAEKTRCHLRICGAQLLNVSFSRSSRFSPLIFPSFFIFKLIYFSFNFCLFFPHFSVSFCLVLHFFSHLYSPIFVFLLPF